MYEGTGLVVFRARAIERFRKHIAQWLDQTRQRLHGTGPIPSLSAEKKVEETASIEVITVAVLDKVVAA